MHKYDLQTKGFTNLEMLHMIRVSPDFEKPDLKLILTTDETNLC